MTSPLSRFPPVFYVIVPYKMQVNFKVIIVFCVVSSVAILYHQHIPRTSRVIHHHQHTPSTPGVTHQHQHTSQHFTCLWHHQHTSSTSHKVNKRCKCCFVIHWFGKDAQKKSSHGRITWILHWQIQYYISKMVKGDMLIYLAR